ncbi:MAG: hypothetical protein JSV65_12500 [Armatimonadota bacterium]|nr:MAG: hypothetical protein JSV65_12500 [Armatimonadota bacterium]
MEPLKTVVVLVALIVVVGHACALRGDAVEVQPGVTSLEEIGAYRVGYQRHGEPVTMMPDGWVGHFESKSGISYTPWPNQGGKHTILLHCPWRGGTGIAFAEYDLELPEMTPIVFTFAIAMQQGRTDESDGATFRALLRTGGETVVLCDEHRKSTDWHDFEADLSRWSGERVTLRLETGPGPNDDPGFDFSLWGEPEITVGGPLSEQERVRAALRARERWRAAVGDTDLIALANRSDVGCRPTCDDKYTNEVRREGETYILAYHGADLALRYELSGDCDPGTLAVRVAGFPPFRVAQGFGPAEDEMAWRLDTARIEGDGLAVRGQYESEGAAVPIAVSLRIAGKTLVVAVEGPAGPEHFSLGSLGPVPLRRVISVPYLDAGDVRYLPHNGLYYSAILDWVDTNASRQDDTTAHYGALTDGSRNPIREVGYITVSPDLREVLPNIPLPPSPYLNELAPRVMLDIWGGAFAENAQLIRDLADYGVTNAAIIKHVWQRGGYDNEYPTVLPANAGLGGDDALREFSRAAAEAGHVFSLHENYIDFYPNSELWDEADVARDAQGEMQKAWFNGAVQIQSYAAKPTALIKYARQFASEIHTRYDTSAAYLDVHTCVPPWFHVDFDAGAPGAGRARTVYDANLGLFGLERAAHGGPLFGEGNNHFYWAGAVDGAEAQVAGGESAPLLVDFDLLKIHPQMVNHGMGYHERWLREGYNGDWGSRVPPQYRMDKYRSMEIAYGHAGFIANQILREPTYAAKEHHLVGPVQALYGAAKALAVEYEVGGRMLDVSDAVAAGVLDRVHVRYDTGLDVWVNFRAQDWQVGDHRIPQHCFFAEAPDLLACSWRQGETFRDYAETPRTIFADARSVIVAPWKDITPNVASFEALGNRRFRVTYEWRVNDALDYDHHVFVHFTDSGPGEGIVFQQDHAPPVPTSQWQPGQTVTDGPYEIEVPESAGERFTWAIGLYRGERVSLRGKLDSSGRVVLGEITVAPDGAVAFAATEEADIADRAAEFERRMNREGKLVDFGKIAADGTVFIRREGGALRVMPIPRGRAGTLTLRLRELGLNWERAQVSAVGVDGEELRGWEAPVVDGSLTLRLEMPQARSFVVRRE